MTFVPLRELHFPPIAKGALCMTCLHARNTGKRLSRALPGHVVPELGTHVRKHMTDHSQRVEVCCTWHAVSVKGWELFTLEEWEVRRAAERVEQALTSRGGR